MRPTTGPTAPIARLWPASNNASRPGWRSSSYGCGPMAACDIMDTVQGPDGLVFSQGDEIHPGICVLCQGCSPFGILVFPRDTHNRETCILVFFINWDQQSAMRAAGAAPGSPKIQQSHFPVYQGRQGKCFPFRIRQGEILIGRPLNKLGFPDSSPDNVVHVGAREDVFVHPLIMRQPESHIVLEIKRTFHSLGDQKESGQRGLLTT